MDEEWQRTQTACVYIGTGVNRPTRRKSHSQYRIKFIKNKMNKENVIITLKLIILNLKKYTLILVGFESFF